MIKYPPKFTWQDLPYILCSCVALLIDVTLKVSAFLMIAIVSLSAIIFVTRSEPPIIATIDGIKNLIWIILFGQIFFAVAIMLAKNYTLNLVDRLFKRGKYKPVHVLKPTE